MLDVIKEYAEALEILKKYEGDPAGAGQALEAFEQHLSLLLEGAGSEASSIEAGALDKMSGNDLEVLVKMLPSLMNADSAFDTVETDRIQRSARLKVLRDEIRTRGKALGTDAEETLRRVEALLEGLDMSEEVFSVMKNVF